VPRDEGTMATSARMGGSGASLTIMCRTRRNREGVRAGWGGRPVFGNSQFAR
jgi:hypothetical protein